MVSSTASRSNLVTHANCVVGNRGIAIAAISLAGSIIVLIGIAAVMVAGVLPTARVIIGSTNAWLGAIDIAIHDPILQCSIA